MRKILSLVLVVLAVNSFGVNPSTNSQNTGSYGKNNRSKRVEIDIYNIKEKVQIVNISELEGKTFIIEGKAYIIPQNNILYVGRVNSQGRIDLEKELKFKKLDDNCITVDRGKTCFTVRSSNMLPELIRVSDGKTISTGYWKNKEFHNFLLNWKGK
jgi:hypothetical protein